MFTFRCPHFSNFVREFFNVKGNLPVVDQRCENTDALYQTVAITKRFILFKFHSYPGEERRGKKWDERFFRYWRLTHDATSVPHWFFTFFCSRKHVLSSIYRVLCNSSRFFLTIWTGRGEISRRRFHIAMKLTRWLCCCYGNIHQH